MHASFSMNPPCLGRQIESSAGIENLATNNETYNICTVCIKGNYLKKLGLIHEKNYRSISEINAVV